MENVTRRLTGLGLSVAAPLLVVGMLLLGQPAAARAADVTVNDCTASGLRAALLAAHDGDVVSFNCTLGNPTIVLTQTQAITRNITLDGGGAITLTGGSTDRILSIGSGHLVSVTNLALEHGHSAQGSALNVFGSVNVDNVTFFDNLGSSASVITGGAIALHNALATIKNSRFVSNSVDSSSVEDWGGAIGGSGTLTVTHSIFVGNSADFGGAIFIAGSGSIVDSLFVSNTANFGGAVAAFGNINLDQDEFERNHALGGLLLYHLPFTPPSAGGALSVGSGATIVVQRSLFLSNTASGIVGPGGAIASAGNLTVFDTLFTGNSTHRDGGAIVNYSQLSISLSSFGHNDALQDGGAISNSADLDMNQSTFFSNTTSDSGGGLANAGRASIQSSQFEANDAGAGYGGGAVNNAPGSLQIGASTFISNSAVIGGALANHGLITVTNSTMANNHGNTEAGALFSGGAGALKALLLNDTVTGNITQFGQAALRQTGGSMTLVDTIVASNSPANCAGTIANGGHSLQFGDASCAGIPQANPLLGPLQDNGGTRVGVGLVALQTRLPLAGSPTLNAANVAACPARDERGFLRLAPCDIGAVERVFPNWLPMLAN